MSADRDFISIFDLSTSQLPVMEAESILPSPSDCVPAFDGVQQYCEEARQQEAYDLYKQDVGQSLQTDSRMENEFFGRRQLSISDFDGTRTIVTPTPSPIKLAYLADDEYTPTPSVARYPVRTFPPRVSNEDYLADDETTPTQSVFASPPQLMNASYFRQSLRSPSRYSPDSPLYNVDGFLFRRDLRTPEFEQRRLDAIQPRSSLRTPTPILWNRHDLPRSPYEPTPDYCESILAEPEQEQMLDSIESDSVYDDEENIAIDWNYNDQANLEGNLGIGLRFDNDSVREVGFVNSHVEIHDDLTERAYAPSENGRISNISTPALTQDHDDIDDLDSVNGVQLGYDASPGTLHFYSQAGIPITTRELQDDFVAAQTTNLAGGILDIDQAAENEKACANANFFDVNSPLMTTASSHILLASRANSSVHIHSPKIKQESIDPDEHHLIPGMVVDLADPDYYLGPDAPAPDDSIFDKVYHARHANGQVLQGTTRPRLYPVVRIGQIKNASLIKRRANREVNSKVHSPQLLPNTTFGQAPKYNGVFFINNLSPTQSADDDNLSPVRISKTPNYGESFLVRKRSARESFDLIELCNENAQREQSRKKPRLMSTTPPESARLPSTPASTMSSIFNGSPMATALQGYPGQFELHTPERFAKQKKATTKHVFGNHLHANGEIINLSCTTDPLHTTKDLSDCPGLAITIEHANLHHSFAEEMPRTDEEEELRKEAHRECAAARLEGVSVGYYRYFAGHMTVEEYVEARMCVCWEGCFCNKLCTHFGDLACPCADSLVVGEDA